MLPFICPGSLTRFELASMLFPPDEPSSSSPKQGNESTDQSENVVVLQFKSTWVWQPRLFNRFILPRFLCAAAQSGDVLVTNCGLILRDAKKQDGVYLAHDAYEITCNGDIIFKDYIKIDYTARGPTLFIQDNDHYKVKGWMTYPQSIVPMWSTNGKWSLKIVNDHTNHRQGIRLEPIQTIQRLQKKFRLDQDI
jgi:hypothetical protein